MKPVGVLGASGRTGKLIVEEALARGWQVYAQVRSTSDLGIEHENLTVLPGEPYDDTIVQTLVSQCSTLLITLNVSRNSDFPWSGLRAPENLISKSVSAVVHSASENFRIISCSAWGVSDSWNQMPGWFRWLVKYSNIGKAYKDHARQENILQASQTDWTIIRPVGLTNSKQGEDVKEFLAGQRPDKLMISRLAVARNMLDAIERKDLIGKIITLSSL